MWIAGAAWGLCVAAAADLPIVELRGDVEVRDRTEWRGAHYQVYGNVYVREGGTLVVEDAVVEMMGTYSREFLIHLEGGRLETRRATLGGTVRDGVVRQSGLQLRTGEWDAEDTTVQYSYGISMGHEGLPIRVRARRLVAGPHPDSVIMSGAADVELEDCRFPISLLVSAKAGGRGELDLPVDTPLTRVFDRSNLPGIDFRLSLKNSTVSLWWVFMTNITRDGPPTEVVFGHCPKLIPSVMAGDLTGTVRLPSPWPAKETDVAELTIGNLTLRTKGEPVRTWCWGVYLWGAGTDVTIEGPTAVCELMLWDGHATLAGTEGTYDSVNACTTVEVGRKDAQVDVAGAPDAAPVRPVQLTMRNVTLGHPGATGPVLGQVTAHRDGVVTVEHAKCGPLRLITRDNGCITMSDLQKKGEFTLQEEGGPIAISP